MVMDRGCGLVGNEVVCARFHVDAVLGDVRSGRADRAGDVNGRH